MPDLPGHLAALRYPDRSSLKIEYQPPQRFPQSVVVMRMLAVAVCGTDLAILSGARPDRARIIGHEGVGITLHAPADSGLEDGNRVIINPVHQRKPASVVGHSRDGIFREFFYMESLEAVEGSHFVKCPKNCIVPDRALALAEPIGSVLYAMEVLQEQCGRSSLLIRGAGTIGILAAKLWSDMAGTDAILFSQSDGHARRLQDWIAWPAKMHVCGPSNLVEKMRECSGRNPFNAAILCCSREKAAEGLSSLLDALPERAVIDLMTGFPTGYQMDRLGGMILDKIRWDNCCGIASGPPTIASDGPTRKQVLLTGHRGTAKRHILQAIELLSQRAISLSDIPHHVLRLNELPGAVNEMLSPQARRNLKWVKAIVDFSVKKTEKTEWIRPGKLQLPS